MALISGGGGGGTTFNGGTITDPLYIEPGTGDSFANGAAYVRSPYNEGNAQGNTLIYVDTLDGSRLFDLRDDGTLIFRSGDGGAGVTFNSQNQTAAVALNTSTGIKLTSASAVVHQLNPTTIGFFGVGATAQPTGVAVSAAGIHAALVTLGLITA